MSSDPKKPQSIKHEGVDRIGALASTLCAAHCVLCALLPAAFSAMGLGVLLGHQAEWLFTLVAVAFAIGALAFSWRRHRSVRVAALLSLGILGMFTSRFLEMSGESEGHAAVTADAGVKHGDGATETGHAAHHEADHDRHAANGSKKTPELHAAHDHHGHHGHGGHSVGAGIGFVAGLLVASGHLLNIRETRRQACCT